MIVDDGNPNRFNRYNIFDIDAKKIGISCNYHP